VTRFLAVSVAGVAAGISLTTLFPISQMGVKFGFECSLDYRQASFFEQAVFSQDVLWILMLFEQFIDQFTSDRQW
jgi:hypothetical protein